MSTLIRLKYDHDRTSNRLYRRDEVARSHSALFDELYDCEQNEKQKSEFSRGKEVGSRIWKFANEGYDMPRRLSQQVGVLRRHPKW